MSVVETAKPKTPLIYNPKVRGIAYQVVLCAVDRVPGLGRDQQRRRQPGARQDRLGLRLLGQHRRLRHQPDADRLFDHLDLWPRVLGRPAQHAAGRGARHRVRDHPRLCHRHRAAVEELAGGAARRRLRRDHPQPAAAAAIAVLVQRRAQGAARACATACAIPGGGFLNNRGLFLPQPVFAGGLRRGADRARRRRSSARSRSASGRGGGRCAPASRRRCSGSRSALVIGAAARRAGAVRAFRSSSTIPRRAASTSAAASRCCRSSWRCCSGS